MPLTARHALLCSALGAFVVSACVPERNQISVPSDAGASVDGTVLAPSDSGSIVDTGTPVKADGGPAPDAGFDADSGVMDSGEQLSGIPVLGDGMHVIGAVVVTEVGSGSDGLDVPTDLEFHPQRPNQLWVVNHGGNSTWIVDNPGEANQSGQLRFETGTGPHFLARPSALAFGANGRFATSQDESRVTQPTTPADFMGPTLWTSDLTYYNGGHESHYDMLHNSPDGMGIAWERDNVYWMFDGWHSSITRYDFHDDHGLGGTDHTDGEISRYVEGDVSRVAGVPSHMVFDHPRNRILIVDTGNNRIAELDPRSGSRGGSIGPNYDGCEMYRMSGASITTFIDGPAVGLTRPSGLEIFGEHIFVTDNSTGQILGFTLDGELVDWLDTELQTGSLMGIAFDGQGRMYVTDARSHRIFRVEPL